MKKLVKFKKFLCLAMSVFAAGFAVAAQPIVKSYGNEQVAVLPSEERKIANYRFFLEQSYKDQNKNVDFNKFQQEADLLFNEINKYADEVRSQGVDVKDFDSHNKAVLAGLGQVKVLNRADFENFLKEDPNVVHLFRGINNREYASKFRSGQVFIGGPVRCSYSGDYGHARYGSAIYTVANPNDALHYATTLKNNRKNVLWHSVGEVADMGLNKADAKIIENADLENIVAKMLYDHPEFCNLADLYSKLIIPEYRHSNLWPILNEAFGRAFGFDLTQIPENFSKFVEILESPRKSNRFDKPFSELTEHELYELQQRFKEFLTQGCHDQKFSAEFDRLMENSEEDGSFVDPAYLVSQDKGFVAHLLGKDLILEDHKASRALAASGQTVGSACCMDEFYLVVNPGVLTVCSDEFKMNEGNS